MISMSSSNLSMIALTSSLMSDIGFFIQVPRFLLTAHIHSFTSGVLGRRARPFVDTELAHDVLHLLLHSAYVHRSFTPPTQRMYSRLYLRQLDFHLSLGRIQSYSPSQTLAAHNMSPSQTLAAHNMSSCSRRDPCLFAMSLPSLVL